MALYAFDGTWNEDEEIPSKDSNVVRFRDAYLGDHKKYVAGVGTRFGFLGRVIGGLFGAGGRTRTYEMYQALKQNWKNGDHVIDIVGFSRGAALAVNFANVINEKGVRAADGNTIKLEGGIHLLGPATRCRIPGWLRSPGRILLAALTIPEPCRSSTIGSRRKRRVWRFCSGFGGGRASDVRNVLAARPG